MLLVLIWNLLFIVLWICIGIAAGWLAGRVTRGRRLDEGPRDATWREWLTSMGAILAAIVAIGEVNRHFTIVGVTAVGAIGAMVAAAIVTFRSARR